MYDQRGSRSGGDRSRPGAVITLFLIPLLVSLIAGAVYMDELPLWWKKVVGDEFVEGCQPYVVYAQNRWDPRGTAVRMAPTVMSEKIFSFDYNEVITVDGWVHATVAYPTNPEPWNSDIWFHLAHRQGWVSFAGVRAVPTPYDPTGHDPEGGQPAATPSHCEGTYP